jgi:hypothetical protein
MQSISGAIHSCLYWHLHLQLTHVILKCNAKCLKFVEESEWEGMSKLTCHVRYWFHQSWPRKIKSVFIMGVDEECQGLNELPVYTHSNDKWNKRIHRELRLLRSWLNLCAPSQRDWNISSMMGCPSGYCLPCGSSRQAALPQSSDFIAYTHFNQVQKKILGIRAALERQPSHRWQRGCFRESLWKEQCSLISIKKGEWMPGIPSLSKPE